ncbi:MAG: type IX secretion system PorP/SprF family membrane protein [Saprospiraceae bacterium]|jgi:type IX secretion system PorP/SprF family membrane protein
MIIIISSFAISAQDAHYSLYQYAPLYLNPAFAGQSQNTNRLVLNYRSQWMNIPPAYRTIGASYDRKKENIGWGLLLNQNDAGSASLTQTNIYFNYALGRQLSERHHISLGGQVGFTQKRFDPTAFSFDAQYSDNGFDETLNNAENFTRTSVLAPDLNIGFLYQLLPNNRHKISGEAGFSFAHLNTPDISLSELDKEDLPVKRLIHAKLNYRVNKQFTVSPRILAITHYTATEITYGILGKYYILPKTALNFGVDIRQDEAFIFTGGIERNNFILAASFDVINSSLQIPANGQGAIEIALIYVFEKISDSTPKSFDNKSGDRDGDGVLNEKDKCPDIAGLIRLEGCPENNANNRDRDGDGIVNERDKCPDIAGVFRLEGCPENAPNQPITKDTDGDGIFDDIDLCPTVPGLPKHRGCNDYDKDGVFDNIDVCPKVYGDESNYGCPINNRNLDSDNDGVLDKDDKCVYLRGKPELNGCPDSDGDGISDILDDCPFLKGPANSGCPVKNARNARNSGNSTSEVSIDVIEFDSDKSFIRPQHLEMLNRVANIMLQNPSYNIMLVGHTDASGSMTYNYQLGQRRSMAIRDYLIRQGVSPNRFQIISYGETIPKDSNVNDNGRQRNRRTEIIIMDNYELKHDTRN